MSLNLFKHLLPRAKAWNITAEKKLRQFFQGLADGVISPTKTYYDLLWLDIFPETTRQIPEWETSFGLLSVVLTEQERRDRLSATWKALGGQSPRYIQDTLRNNGFDVYVHEWWEPGFFPLFASYCGDALAECGEPGIECTLANLVVRNPLDVLAPDNITPVVGKGYPLVNKIIEVNSEFTILCGEAIAECGEAAAVCNNYDLIFDVKEYFTTTDPLTWPYYLYIGDQTFGDIASVALERRDEFEELCLKICPTQVWLGILVDYV